MQKQGYHYADEDAHDLPPTDENDDQGLRSTLGTPYVEFYTSEETTDEILQEHQTTGKGNKVTLQELFIWTTNKCFTTHDQQTRNRVQTRKHRIHG